MTKTELDGFQPKFVANDKILVSNGTSKQECTVSVKGGVATISTELEGPLTAVYPSTAAKMNGSNPNQIDGIKVPTEQDGTFASANICKAEIPADATSATFENQTAIFKLQIPSDSEGYAAKSVKATSGVANIADGSKTITVSDGTSSVIGADGYCYVAVLPGETASHMTVGAGCGCRSLTGDDVIAINKIYTIALPVKDGHEYVEIGGKKWATMNVGATAVAGSP